MPKFTVSIEFDLVTEIEPDLGYHSFDSEGVEEFNDGSYFSAQPITCDGGNITLIVEAEDEHAANEKAREVVSDGSEVEDRNGLTWLVESVNIEIEEVEIPMTLERAREILTQLIAGGDDEEVREAVDFVFAHVAELNLKVTALQATVASLRREVEAGRESTQAPTEPAA